MDPKLLTPKIIDQIIVGTKICIDQKNFGPKFTGPKYCLIMDPNFFTKIFGLKDCFHLVFLESTFFFGQTVFRPKNLFGLRIFGPKFLIPNSLGSKIFVDPKLFLDPKFVLHQNIFLNPTFFRTQNFLYP